MCAIHLPLLSVGSKAPHESTDDDYRDGDHAHDVIIDEITI